MPRSTVYFIPYHLQPPHCHHLHPENSLYVQQQPALRSLKHFELMKSVSCFDEAPETTENVAKIRMHRRNSCDCSRILKCIVFAILVEELNKTIGVQLHLNQVPACVCCCLAARKRIQCIVGESLRSNRTIK